MNAIKISILVLGGIGFLFSVLLAFLSKKLRVKEDARVEQVLNLLPGLNCGACGFSGCLVYAKAVVSEGKIFGGCLPGGKTTNDAVAKLLGFESLTPRDKKVAVCRCGANASEKKVSFIYHGLKTCQAAHLTSGSIDCVYGCLGFGDCVKACPVGAIKLENMRVRVNVKKCVGCGKCVGVCPRGLFELVPLKEGLSAVYYVACSNKQSAASVRKVCTRGCIGCGICAKVNNSPFYLKENLSYIDYQKQDLIEPQEEAKNKCPTKCILKENV